jgi:peptidoglycan hydrolase-like protein with peptidoglycan-binding domain
VQRRLAKLGFETKINGKFDDSTRIAITRWQEEHGYSKTGFLNTEQHRVLLNESVAGIETGKSDDDHPNRRSGRAHHRPRRGRPTWRNWRHGGRTIRTQVSPGHPKRFAITSNYKQAAGAIVRPAMTKSSCNSGQLTFVEFIRGRSLT